jgi:hypothetical protein
MARGSLLEMASQVMIAENLGYLSQTEVRQLGRASGEVKPPAPRADPIASGSRMMNWKPETGNEKLDLSAKLSSCLKDAHAPCSGS